MRQKTVLSIHGIRTRAAWQKADLSQMLADSGFSHIPLDFGYFLVLSLLLRPLREKKVRWFWDQYDRFAGDLAEPPHVIAHSFGSYIVCEALRMHGEIKIDRLILCGSIVDPRFPWSDLFEQKRIAGVLNDYGSADIWTKIVGLALSDAGPSGRTGFTETDSRLIQRRLPGWHHSDFFNRLHFSSWIRFLKDGKPGMQGVDAPSPSGYRTWVRRLATLAICAVLFVLGFVYLTRPVPIREGVLAMQYGILGSGGTWKSRSFVREFGDADQQPREGDNVIALRPVSAFSRIPRHWLALQLGAPSDVHAGDRFQVRETSNPIGHELWFVGAPISKPEGYERFNYEYQYSYDEGCSGFLMSDRLGNWVEYTPGDGNCTKTIYPFTEVARTAEFIILYDRSGRGYYFRIPVAGGHTALAGPYLPPNVGSASLSWSRHYKVRHLRL